MLDHDALNRIHAAAASQRDALIGFARRAVKTPSPSGQEGAMADLVRREMERVSFDDVWVDDVGNVVGVVRGTGGGRRVLFNSHLDQVAEGDPARWSHPPFGAEIVDGVLYGRGASDVKGALAAQVYLAAALLGAGLRPDGDVFVAAVVLEEVGGFGTEWLCRTLPCDVCVLGEPTGNELRRGHRGRAVIAVSFAGRSVHASVPNRDGNPHFALARFIERLDGLRLPSDSVFGGSSLAPTVIGSDQESANVTPGTLRLLLDYRSLPSEDVSATVDRLRELAVASCGGHVSATVRAEGWTVRTYTGVEATMPPKVGYELPVDHPKLLAAQRTLESALERPIPVDVWHFTTDGGILARHGVPTIGFSPCEEQYPHTVQDQVSLAKMAQAVVGNAALAVSLSDRDDGRGT
ncbi:MAG TPA: M20/M25/M40 family metallo-hydrolase [Thermomicrobiaceae bacterium]|nr:M20/M25/M40 family metallo-hydrolase [Thermomicrobiaceae bacterium]